MEYRTTTQQLKSIRDQISSLIQDDSKYAKNENTNFFVRIDGFDSSIDMLVQAFTETNDWGEF